MRVTGADVVITIVPDSPDVEAVVLGEHGVQAAARDAGGAIPVTALVAQMLVSLRSLGRGSLDHSAILTLIEDLPGRGRDRPPASS